ncbi:hypothetical protein [Streptomyces sp. WM6372]|nr:hypothetical protein [Streptomyces sp. WM6372]
MTNVKITGLNGDALGVRSTGFTRKGAGLKNDHMHRVVDTTPRLK